MLSKLIKYDIRSTWRDFAGVYLAILLGVIILPQVFKYVDNVLVNVLAGFIATAIVITTVVVMIVTIFKIFNANVFSKTGYLTMTLPATSTEIVSSKLLVSTMWVVLTGIVATLGVVIFVCGTPVSGNFFGISREFLAMLEGHQILALVLIIVMMVISTVKEIAKLFLSCSVAHLKPLGRFRVPVGILSYFVFSWLEVLVLKIVGLVAGNIPGVQEYINQISMINDLGTGIEDFFGTLNSAIGLGILYDVILVVVYSIGTIWFLNHKLDLD